MPELQLPGCTPEPLMSYLKALGVFRLIAEDKEHGDPCVRGCWRGGVFVLETTLDRDALTKFFLEQYKPTPIVVPWSGGDFFAVNESGSSGPFDKTPSGAAIIDAFLATESSRLADYRLALRTVFSVMRDTGIVSKASIEGTGKRREKKRFLTRLRSELPDQVIDWMDAATQLAEAETEFTFNPLLGSGGGSDGNTHFSDNFMQNLWDCLPDFDGQRRRAKSNPDIRNALFNELVGDLTVKRSGSLFDSGAVEGTNATQGFRREALMNPWNFVLGLEGTLVFAGGMAKRLGVFSTETPAFPFTVQMSAAGCGSAASKEAGQKELWVPLWEKPSTFPEFTQFTREGRAQVGRRPAKTGTDFSRAVATLGVSAGVDSFIRYGIVRGRVGGENYHTAAALGQFRVHYDKSLTLLEEIDPWLNRVRIACESDDAPVRYATAFRRLEDAIVEGGKRPAGLLVILRALSRMEQCLSVGGFRTTARIKPLQGLSPQWLDQANDGSAEFALAASLAGIGPQKDVGPLRVFLEEVETKGSFFNWSPGSTSAVWSKRPLAENLAAVFRRRQMEAFRSGQLGVPLNGPKRDGPVRPAPLNAVLKFLEADTDDEKLNDLLWGLSAVNWSEVEDRSAASDEPSGVLCEFGLARLLVNPLAMVPDREQWAVIRDESEHATKHDSEVFHAIAAGRQEAVERAARRLRSCGLSAIGHRNRQTASQPIVVVSLHLRPGHSSRLLAAMLFPLSNRDLTRIANAVLYPPETQE